MWHRPDSTSLSCPPKAPEEIPRRLRLLLPLGSNRRERRSQDEQDDASTQVDHPADTQDGLPPSRLHRERGRHRSGVEGLCDPWL